MIKPYLNGILLRLYIGPASSKTCWDKVYHDRQKVRISAPPVDGAANEELITFIAKSFKVSKSRVHLLRGMSSKQKDLYVEINYQEALSIFKTLTNSF